MDIELGRISAIFRYPVKSMAGESIDPARLGWHGFEGDRRFAIRRLSDEGGFPWLSASRLPKLLLYRPFGRDETSDEPIPTHVHTPEGASLELRSPALTEDISRRYGSDVALMRLKHGIFDEATVSVITGATVRGIEREVDQPLGIRRFRPNIVMETNSDEPFPEDAWVGRTLVFGAKSSAPAVSVTMRDERCVMINFDPDTAVQDPGIMKAVVRMNHNNAGVYATVIRAGEICVGQEVWLS